MTSQAAVFRALVRVTAAAVIVHPGPSHAQKIRLEVRPRAGDTLRVQLEHAVTISSAPRTGYAAIAPSTTTYRLHTREIVERVTTRGSAVVAVVDSVLVTTADPQNAGLFPGLDRSLHGTRVGLTFSRDGASTIIDGSTPLDADLRAFLGETPAVLPPTGVAVGEMWIRAFPMPMDASSFPGRNLRSTLRLDSLTESGNLAWISVNGAIPSATKSDTAQRSVDSKGTLSGSLILDRKRGWIVDSRVVVNIESIVAMPGTTEPLVVNVRVTQTMKTARR